MDASKFNKTFDEVIEKASSYWNNEQVMRRLEKFSDKDGQLSLENAVMFAQEQSRDYTERFVYDLLFSLLVDKSDKA